MCDGVYITCIEQNLGSISSSAVYSVTYTTGIVSHQGYWMPKKVPLPSRTAAALVMDD